VTRLLRFDFEVDDTTSGAADAVAFDRVPVPDGDVIGISPVMRIRAAASVNLPSG
jgi:hypothetical protein